MGRYPFAGLGRPVGEADVILYEQKETKDTKIVRLRSDL